MQAIPLTDTQLAVYTYCRAHPDEDVYTICMKFGPYKSLDPRRLKHATEKAIDNHNILKIRITTTAYGAPAMARNDDENPVVEFIKAESDFKKAVPISGRLYNAAVIDDANGCALILCVHHLVFDGYSMNILANEISQAYLGDETRHEKKTFFDIANDEATRKKSAAYNKAKQFFAETFTQLSARTIPPPDCNGKHYKPTFYKRKLPISLNRWAEICDALRQTSNVVSITAFAMVLGCFCGEEAARFSTVFHGRHGRDVENTVGMFVKTIPVSAAWRKGEKTEELLRLIRWQLARCMVNDIFPFSEIRRICGGFGDISFIYQGNTQHTATFCGQKLISRFLTPSFTGSSLSMELWHGEECLEMQVEYDAAKYSQQLIENMIDAFTATLNSMATATNIEDINFLSPAMASELDNFNPKHIPPVESDIIQMFSKIVNKNPSSIAVKYLDKQLTYSELDSITNQIANYLVSLGAGIGKNVAIKTGRSEMLAVLPLAVLKTGAAYVPLSDDCPDEVLKRQQQICNADIILTANDLYQNFPPTPPPSTQKHYFSLFFTSGSSGSPKAVKVTHKNVAAYCQWYSRYFSPSTGTVIAAYNNFAFDASITDIFPALTSGATVAIVPKNIKTDLTALAAFCDANNVTIIDLPTQIGRIFAANKRCKTLKHIVLGGEAVSPFQNIGNYQIYNQYGPTETTVAVTIHEITGDESQIPIGKPLDNVKIYVTDSYNRKIPTGAIGEIWIAGAQVTDGYTDAVDNRNKFIVNPFDNNPDFSMIFRSGDYGRWLPDGDLEYHGRRDNLVKIHGYRVEINDLETALKKCDGVVDAAATTYEHTAGTLEIMAYITGNQKLDIVRINSELARRLPTYMLPKHLQQIEHLPTTPNGKIDRKRLPKPEPKSTAKTVGTKPLSTLENIICQVFAEVLNRQSASADDDFFEIGGTSISAMQAVVKLEDKGYRIKYGDIFEHATPRKLAAMWRAGAPSDKRIVDNSQNMTGRATANITKRAHAAEPVGYIILTGSTGFFGAHLLRELLEKRTSKIICLVRRDAHKSAAERLKDRMLHYFGETTADSLDDRISIIDCDMTDKQAFNALDAIPAGNTTVVNCAAIVKHFAERKTMYDTNVRAVKLLADLCLRRKWRLVQISTLSVESTHIDAVPYVKSKWEAERIALDANANGLDLNLIRLGNLAPRSTDNVFQINASDNAAMNLTTAIRRLGCYPECLDNLEFDITPVDYAARETVRIIYSAQPPIVSHVANPTKTTVSQIVDARKVPDGEFRQRLRDLPTEMRVPIDSLVENLGRMT